MPMATPFDSAVFNQISLGTDLAGQFGWVHRFPSELAQLSVFN